MQNNVNTNLERIIAKIDNDFNPDNSDWIPRVGAWCIDAMSMLNCLCTIRKKETITVKDRIAQSNCPINNSNFKVYDNNGCEIKEAKRATSACGCPSTGRVQESETTELSTSAGLYETANPISNAPDYLIAETLNADKEWPGRYRVNEYYLGERNVEEHNYVVVDCNKIELNFDTNCITIEYDAIKTEPTSLGYEVPVIPNNGLLIEALVYFCMYKMLCRGYKHPVFNLQASQYGTNPFYIWNQMKEEARRSIIANKVDTDSEITKILRSNFYINTFDPRR